MTKKLDRGITLVFVVLIMGLLAGSVSATTIEKEIIVSEKDPFSIEFTVEETGVIYAEAELKGAIEEIELILESQSGEVKRDVWGEMPLSLKYEVSKDDIAEGTEWKISVRSGLYDEAYGTLKITYPDDTTPPTIAITCSPENPTADQQITFIATASDRSGIDKIEILVNERKVEEYFDSYSCTYVGGPYPDYAGTSVSYGANAYDKAGNRAWTGYKRVSISEAMDITPPTAIISASPTEINEGEGVSFSAEASSDQDGSIVSYDWDFGDGYTDTGINVEHAYSHSGHYTATLMVTDNDGLSGSNRIEITVNPLTSNTPPTIPWTWILAATVLVIAAALIIIVAMKKPSQLQINIETRGGIESMHEPELQHYTINVEVRGGIGRL